MKNVINVIKFVFSRFRTKLFPANHLITRERTKFDTEQKYWKFLLESMTLLTFASNFGSEIEFILRGRSYIYIIYIIYNIYITNNRLTKHLVVRATASLRSLPCGCVVCVRARARARLCLCARTCFTYEFCPSCYTSIGRFSTPWRCRCQR
jgi:hypothetical protein